MQIDDLATPAKRSKLGCAVAVLSLLSICAWIISFAVIIVGSLADSSARRFIDTLGNPLSNLPSVVFWTSTTVEFVINALLTFSQRAALSVDVRARSRAATSVVWQGIWVVAYVALLVINLLRHNYAAAAAFGALGALLFAALKLAAGAAVTGASGAAGVDMYRWAKKRLVKSQTETNRPDA
jgi:hypothetical protein